MISLIGTIVVALLLILVFKYFTGKSKPSQNRSSMEKIACSLFSIFRRNVDDAANSLRSARVMRDEAMQEVSDAIRNLKSSYQQGQTNMRVALNKLKNEILPNLRDQPGKLEGKARKAKKDYQASVEKGTPIEAYKQNAIKYLQLKNKATMNIKRTEDNIVRLEVAIETSKAQYDGNITDLEMIKSELESMVDIPQIELNNSLARIQSLQSELSDRMNVDAIQAEVQSEMREEESATYSADLDAEFNNL